MIIIAYDCSLLRPVGIEQGKGGAQWEILVKIVTFGKILKNIFKT